MDTSAGFGDVADDRSASARLRGRDVALALGTGIPAGLLVTVLVAVALRVLDVDVDPGAAFTLESAAFFGPIGALAWYFCGARRGGGLRALGVTNAGAGAAALMLPLALALTWIEGLVTLPWARLIGEDRNPQLEVLAPRDSLSPARLAWLFVALVVIAPVVEEVVFRGMVYRYLRQRAGIVVAAMLSAALFAAAHGYLVVLPALFVFGVALALVTERFDSIVPAIALHAAKNALALVALYATLRYAGA